MSTTAISTGQPDSASTKGDTMGVASLATKRHLESPMDGDEVVSAKIAKLNQNNNNNDEATTPLGGAGGGNGELASQIIVQDSSSENSSELVTTSILARTLLTTSSSGSSSLIGVASQYAIADPLESLKSTLEALPAPAILDSHSAYLTSNGSTKSTILQGNSNGLVGFTSLLGPERCSPLATAVTTVLSPIDEDPIEWNNPAKATPVMNGISSEAHHGMNPSISSLTSLVDHQLQQQLNGVNHHHLNGGASPHHEVITEDENGKSYFNLGSAQDSTILARKSSISSESGWGGGSSCGGGSGNNSADFDDAISSSSCDSISSEDLFNSGEEFDASDDEDEDELCTYKQQRSTVLHLSLCKLNKFRTNCVEPSLHRSVLICNTLRHIEQEIRNEDEAADEQSLKSRERLPSFWPSPPPPLNNPSNQNNCFPPPPGGLQSSQPQITDTRPNAMVMGGGLGGGPLQSGGALGLPPLGGAPTTGMLGGVPPQAPSTVPNGGHDPYLTPNPYSEAPYLSSYDYNSPRPTPFHTTSYDYEQDLLLPPPPNASPSSTAPSQASSQTSSMLMSDVASGTSSLLECDSGYSDDLDMSLSSYYYTSPIPPPPPIVSLPPVSAIPVTSSHQSSLVDFNSVAMSSSLTGASNSSSVVSSNGAIQVSSTALCSNSSPPTTSQSSVNPYLQCSPSFQQLPPPQPPTADHPIMTTHLLNTVASGSEHLTTLQPPTSSSSTPMEISDIGEIRNSTSSPSGGASTSNNSCEQYTMASNTSTTCSSTNESSNNLVESTTNSASIALPDQHHLHHHEQQPESTSPLSQSPCNSPPHQSSCSMLPPQPPSTIIPTTASSPSTATLSSTTPPSSPPSSPLSNTFAQQDSQCGLESRRSDLSRNVGNHYNNHNLPMDSLISPSYSSSSL